MTIAINNQTSKLQSRWLALPWWGQVSLLWLGVLLVLNLIGLLATRILDLGAGYDPVIGVSPSGIPGIWARWDSPYYIDLANNGYEALPYAMGYFPLYPALISIVSRLTGLPLATSGMVIAQLAYLCAALLFYKLARQIRDDHSYAFRSVVFLILFPTSFFFFAIYAESLSLLFSILAIYLVMVSTPRYILSGLALSIASAARPVGWLVNVVLITEFIRRRDFGFWNFFKLGLALLLSISSILLFVYYLYTITGSFFSIPEATALWGRQWQIPFITYFLAFRNTFLISTLAQDWFLYVINWSDLIFTTFAIAMTGLALWRAWKGLFPWSLSLYLLFSVTFLLSYQGLDLVPLWGMTRWVGALFPLYLLLADLKPNSRLPQAIALVFGGLLVIMTAWWTTGRWIG